MRVLMAAALAAFVLLASPVSASTVAQRDRHINQYLSKHLAPEDADAWATPERIRVTDGFAFQPHPLKAAWVSAILKVGYVKLPKPEPVLASSLTPVSAPAGVGAAASYSGVWEAVAACEGGSNWSLFSTGNGYYFVLQFAPSTWLAYGGTQAELDAGVAPSRSRLIQVAEAVLNGQGPGAWPNCFPG